MTDNNAFIDDIYIFMNDDGSWPDMPDIDSDLCPLQKVSDKVSPAATLVNEPHHYTSLPDDINDMMPLSLKSLLTRPTPGIRTSVPEHPLPSVGNLPFTSACHRNSPPDIPIPPPVPLYQPKWIHRRLWAREDNDRENRRKLFPSNVMPRSWSKGERNVPPSQPEFTQKQGPNRVVTIQTHQQFGLARSSSMSASVASTMSSHTVTKCQLTPKKSILSSRTSTSRKHSKHGRSRSGSTQSVKFADAPTYYYDNEYKYAYEDDGYEEYASPTPSSTTTCLLPLSPPRKGATAAAGTSTVRKALGRLIPSTRRSPERPSISGPYPLWKDKDGDDASIRSGKSIPSSVRSAPASRGRVRTFWGRMMACTTQ